MKRTQITIQGLGALLLLLPVLAGAVDVTGIWRFEQFPDSEMIMAQDGSKVYCTTYHEHNGERAAVIAYGIGIIDGSSLRMEFKVVRRPNEDMGGKSGVTYQDLQVSPNGNVITGTWRNDSGNGKAPVLYRIK